MDLEAIDLWKTITNEEKYIMKYNVSPSQTGTVGLGETVRLGVTG